jgi:hypothetical protein
VKDLRSRWHALVLIFALGTLVGCASLQGGPAQNSSNNSLVIITPQVNFGTVVVGRSKIMNAVVQNRTAFGIMIKQATISDPQFQIVSPQMPFSIRPGQSVSLQVQFKPQGAGSPSSTVAISSTASNPQSTLMLSAQAVTAGQLSPSSTSISFGSVKVGQTLSKIETLSNSGSTSLTVSQLSVAGAGFQVSGVNVPFALDPGQSQAFTVTYAPQTAGTSTGSVTINSSIAMTVQYRSRFRARDTQAESSTIPLSGTATAPATGQLAANPASVSFANVQVNSNSSTTVVLQNTGTANVNISQATVLGTGFTLSGLTAPATIAAGQSASFSVKFAPTAAGAASGSVSITSDASNSPLSIALSGTGAAPGSLTTGSSVIAFGTVQVGSSQKQSATITNSGGSSLTISGATISGTGFTLSGITTPLTLAAGASTTFSVTFAPQSATSASGSVSIASNATGSPLTFTLSGTGVAAGSLTANPSSLSFGTIQTGTNSSLQETITNSGGSSVSISQITASGSFSVTGVTLPVNLAAGQSTSFTVKFAPTSSGAANSTLTVTSNASNPSLAIPLSGTGAAPGSLTAGTSPLGFGNVTVGQTQSLSETITNSGGSTVTVSQVAPSGSGFSVSGITVPFTLAAGTGKTFSVTFAPASSGAASSTLTVTSDASNPTLSVSMTGTGVATGSLTAGTSPLAFGNVTVGQTQALSETITNSGGTTVTVSQVAASGSGFTVTGVTVPFTLAAGSSKTFGVSFAPAASGAASSTLSITSDASNPTLSVSMAGAGVAVGSLNAGTSPLAFGNVTVGQTQSLSETITNSGGSTVTVSQVAASGSGFTVTGVTVPFTLAAGSSKTFSVSFAPVSSGAASSTLSITSDASNPTLSVSITGTGVTPGTLAAGTSPISFGSVNVGQSQTVSETVTNSGGSSVTVSQLTVSGSGFGVSGATVPFTLAAGASKAFSVSFAPTASGSASGTLSVSSNASNPTLSVALSGSGTATGSITATPASLSFGSVLVGNSSSLSAVLTNTGSITVNVSQVNLTGAGFSTSGLSLPLALAAGKNFTFSVVFTPTSAGAVTGSLTVVSDATNTPSPISLSGTGTAVGAFAVNPASFAFGSVTVGSSKNMTATLSATGGSVTVSSASVSSSEFQLSGPALPLTIAAGKTATFTVTYSPQASGSSSSTATFVTNASGSPLVASLTGTGSAPVQHTVNLNWSASTSAVSGYNVYRSTTSGAGYAKVNSSLDANTSYSDGSVTSGTTYYYVTTAVDSSGHESAFSNQVQAVVPTP